MSNIVRFTNPVLVTNASCCSDGTVMCDKCAAAALAARGGGRTLNHGGGRVDPNEDLDMAASQPLIEREVPRPTVNDCEDWEMGVQPLIERDRDGNAIEPAERSRPATRTSNASQQGFGDEDLDMAPPPLVTNAMRRRVSQVG